MESLINDKECNTIVVTTRHDSHANLVIKSLKKGKNIFVEKPLCLNFDEFESIKNEFNKSNNNHEPNKYTWRKFKTNSSTTWMSVVALKND